MNSNTIKRWKVLSIAVFFILALSTSPVWADQVGSAHISGGHYDGPSHHVSGTDTKGKSEGSKSKKHHSVYSGHSGSQSEHSEYSHTKKHSGFSKGGTWGRGTYNKGHGNSLKHSEGSKGKKYGGHSSKGYGHKSGHGEKKYGSHSHRSHSHGKDPFVHVLKYKEALGLSDAQVTAIKNQQFEFEKVSIRSNADHNIAHMDLDRVIHSGNVDEAKARGLADKIAETKTRKIKAMVEGKLAVVRILTADQKRIISRMYNRHN